MDLRGNLYNRYNVYISSPVTYIIIVISTSNLLSQFSVSSYKYETKSLLELIGE